MKQTIFLKFIFISFLLSACSSESFKKFDRIPDAYGDLNQLIIIADNEVWEGAIGDTLRYYYSSAYPILPQPEPILDLKHFTSEELTADPLRKELRHYLIIGDLKDKASPTMRMIEKEIGSEKVRAAQETADANNVIRKDRWALGQMIIYQMGDGEEGLIDNLRKNFPAAQKRLREEDKRKLDATVYLDGRSRNLEDEVKTTLGVEMKVPGDYIIALNEDNTVWLRRETNESSSNILLYKTKYKDASQLTKEGIKNLRDSLGRLVASEIPGTYMRINDKDLPLIVTSSQIQGNYALEARGIWEIVNDYMGGAFISYAILSPDQKTILFADGFIHAPGKNKRNFMQYIDHVLHSIRI